MKKIILIVTAVVFLSSCGLYKIQRDMNKFNNKSKKDKCCESKQPGDHGAPFNEDK
jgi:uncharacterized protein YxeA